MKIVIAGGTGFLGSLLIDHFKKNKVELVVLTRQKSHQSNGVNYVHWDGQSLGEWTQVLGDADVLINLSGKSVDCRYTEENKNAILNSRVEATKVLGQAMALMPRPAKLWINASTATIYEASMTQIMDEATGVMGNDFSMNVAKKWEQAFFDAPVTNTRKVALRISLVLGKKDGVIPVLSKLTKFGLGGRQGSGHQKFAWIHEQDMVNIVQYVIDNEQVEGPINCVSPSDINNKEFMAALRKANKMTIGLPAYEWMIHIGTFFMRTEPELILKSRYVYPKILLDLGFKFQFIEIDSALATVV